MMTRAEAGQWARRIQGLPVAEQIKLLARIMIAEVRDVPLSRLDAIQRRIAKLNLDSAEVDRDAVEAVRSVRRDRRRGTRN